MTANPVSCFAFLSKPKVAMRLVWTKCHTQCRRREAPARFTTKIPHESPFPPQQTRERLKYQAVFLGRSSDIAQIKAPYFTRWH